MLTQALDLDHSLQHFRLSQPQDQWDSVFQGEFHLALYFWVVWVGGLGFDAYWPEFVADLEALGDEVFAYLGYVDLSLSGTHGSILSQFLFQDSKNTFNTNGHTHSRYLFPREHAN